MAANASSDGHLIKEAKSKKEYMYKQKENGKMSQAFGACAYVRWEVKGGLFKSSLILSKNRLTPIKKMSIDRIELRGAIINKQIKVLVQQQCRYHFQKFYHK